MALLDRFSKRESILNPDREMSLVEHLGELRKHLIVSIASILILSLIGVFAAKPVLDLLTSPIQHVPIESYKEDLLTIDVSPDGTLRMSQPIKDFHALKTDNIRFRFVDPAAPPPAAQGNGSKITQAKSDAKPPREVLIGAKNENKFFYRNPIDPLMLQIKIGLMIGIILSLPVILRQIWLFVSPGLTQRERKVVRPMLGWGLVLFPIGGCFAFVMVRVLLVVMQSYRVENVNPLLDIFEYLSLLTTLMLVFGIIFELPLFVTIAARLGLVTPKLLTTYRRHCYVGLAVAAMVLTPGDPMTMLMAFFPLVALFEISVLLSRPMHLAYKKSLENGPPDNDDDLGSQFE